MTRIIYIYELANKIYKIDGVLRVKELLRKGFSPTEISQQASFSLNEVISIIETYKPAKRWAVINGHHHLKQTVGDIMDEFKPDFEYMLEMSRQIKKEVEQCKI